MTGIYIYLTIYFIIFALLSLKSYKLSISMICMTILLCPSILANKIIDYMILFSLISSFLNAKQWSCLYCFIIQHKIALGIYCLVSFCIIFFSEIVPFTNQFHTFRGNFLKIILVIEIFLLCKGDYNYSKSLLLLICICVMSNVVYSVIFEIVLRMNPAGLPLYILLGVDNDEFLVDMIDSGRGMFDFRLQSVYGHPLSYGQYFLVLAPVLLLLNNRIAKILLIACVGVIIFLTGTRGAIAPFALLIMFFMIEHLRKMNYLFVFIVVLLASVATIVVLADDDLKFDMFWSDKSMASKNYRGSSWEMRLYQMDAAFDEIDANPMFGKGYGYREFFQKKFGGSHPKLLGYESVLLLHLVERGYIGLVFFFITIYYVYCLFKGNTQKTSMIVYVLFAYCSSIILTGVRPLSFLFVGLSCSIICGLMPKFKCEIHGLEHLSRYKADFHAIIS